ncbi:MAG TPA: FKBP-type peptidyl-prolyl cis-trans isomerase, partial [Chryseosolibacter sp.]|nr:FKBP-type peptidyl-prolyl cis-trans isomerase [Chryseosolibacter sp.]
LISLAATFSSCNEDRVTLVDPLVQFEKDLATIDTYLEANNIDAEKHASGIRTVVHEIGTGLPAYASNTVTITYDGRYFPDGASFDDGTLTQPLNTYIRGWQYAFITLPAGSKATLYVPSYLAYGSTGQGEIDPNTILQFEVEFHSVDFTTLENEKFAADTTAIRQYLTENEIATTKDSTGLHYVITNAGSGVTPSWFDEVKVKYTVRNLVDDETVVQTVDAEPTATFNSRTIDFMHAIKIALQKLKPKGKATLYVPSRLGFGSSALLNSSGRQVLPANSNIIVELELLEVVAE